MKKRKGTYSLSRQVLAVIMIGYICVISVLIYFNFYSIASYYRDIQNSNAVSFSLYAEEMNSILSNTDNYLTDISVNNIDFNAVINYVENAVYSYLSEYNLVQLLANRRSSVRGLLGFVISYGDTGHIRYEIDRNMDYLSKMQVIEYVRGASDGLGDYYSWQVVDSDTGPYLVRILQGVDGEKTAYLAAVIDFRAITSDINNFEESEARFIFTSRGRMLSEEEFAADIGFQADTASQELEQFFYCGNYSVIGTRLDNTDVEMYIAMPGSGWRQLRFSQVTMTVVTLLTCASIPFIYLYLKKRMVKPLEQLVVTMTEIKNGNLDAKMEEDIDSIEELQQVNETFNSMISEIKTLRIDTYEKELEKQKAQLQYLQLQIKPHFYLNCLKTLNAMVMNKNYGRMQDLIINISNHFRYMFKDNFALVPLNEELNYVKRYFQLQETASSIPFTYYMDIEARVIEYRIPPLTIQTFVENSIKYAGRENQKLTIQIRAIELQTEDGKFLDITISDDGIGYPDEVLEAVNSPDASIYGDRHVGILNLKNRFRLLYGMNVEYVFMNASGAVSELIIPVLEEEAVREQEQREE